MMNLGINVRSNHEANLPFQDEDLVYVQEKSMKAGVMNHMNHQRLLSMLQRLIASLDKVISAQVCEIIYHPQFAALEASWRSLAYLVNRGNKRKNIKIRVLNITKSELRDDVSKVLAFDQSQLFSKVYNEEFDTPGGEPFGVLIGDYEFSHHPEDVEILQVVSQVAAAAFAPFIAGASPAMFGINHHSEFGMFPDLETIFKQSTYTRWNFLRQTDDSRFLGLVVPHFLVRQPYSIKHRSKYPFFFKDPKLNRGFLWGNASYAFGAVLIQAFANYGWLANIRGCAKNLNEGGNVPSIVKAYFKTDSVGLVKKINTDVLITDGLEKTLDNLGFITLCQSYNGGMGVFYGNASVQKPKVYKKNTANQNARVSIMLQHIFCASRFAHYLKIMGRDKVGSYMSASACQSELDKWLMEYVAANSDLSAEMGSIYPLQKAEVKVRDTPGKPGYYMCIIYLQPRFQLEQIVTNITLVTELLSTAT
jgi:type VI secretion system protein ImpD